MALFGAPLVSGAELALNPARLIETTASFSRLYEHR